MSLMREERRFALIAIFESVVAFSILGFLAFAAVIDKLTLMLTIQVIVLVSFAKFLYQCFQVYESIKRRECSRLSLLSAWQNRQKLSEFWTLMCNGYLASIFIAPFKYGDVLILGVFTSTSDVGLYKTAKSIASLVRVGCNTLAVVLFQDMNELIATNQYNQLIALLKRLTVMWSSVLSLVVFVVLPIAPLFTGIIFGADFIAGVPIFITLFIGSIPGLITFWSIQLAIAIDVYSKSLPAFYVTQFFNYALALWGVSNFGAIGLAVAVSIHWSLSLIIFLPYSIPKLCYMQKYQKS